MTARASSAALTAIGLAGRLSIVGRIARGTIAAFLAAVAVGVACAGIATTGAARSGLAAVSPFAVGFRMLRLVDSSRTIRLPGGRTAPREVDTIVRYPALGSSSLADLDSAPADRGAGPFPLVVFAHGFAVTPATYGGLLRTWTRAGYVVAAPVFPLTNANAPGGPKERDLVHQPADISFVITSLLAASAAPSGPLSGLIDPARIAVAGHSDGAETALAVGYNSRVRDRRVRAALVMSGAEMTGLGRYRFDDGEPALLAVQGTADRSNPPHFTRAYYRAATRPKFLLTLPGARHLAPYTWEQPQSTIIAEATTAFLDHYLKQASLTALLAVANRPPFANLVADP